MQLPNPPPIYLDNHATTPVDPRVAAVIVHMSRRLATLFGFHGERTDVVQW